MTPFHRSTGAIAMINLKFAYGICFGFIAWLIWPTGINYWGFGLLSIMIALSALAVTGGAIVTLIKLLAIESAIRNFSRRGRQPKSAKLAGDDDLEQAGML